jgi:hypothetical protein
MGDIAATAAGLGIPAPQVENALALLVERPELAPALDRQVERLTAAIGTLDVPDWPAGLGADTERFQLLALLGTVPATRAWFAANGVAPEVARDSLADLPAKLRDYGIAATGIDWLTMILTARVFALGRLQFEPHTAVTGPHGEPTSEPAFGVHIPELGPLDPAGCDASFARASAFFASVIGDTTTRAFVCHSWLMDDQLAHYLPAESNIMRFQRRFELVDTTTTDAPRENVTHGDTAVAKFVFRAPLGELPSIAPASRLERAVIDHLAAGGHWRERTGVIRF